MKIYFDNDKKIRQIIDFYQMQIGVNYNQIKFLRYLKNITNNKIETNY